MKKIITILLLCILASHISETFLKKSCYVEMSQENDEEKCMKKVEKKDTKEFFCHSAFLSSLHPNPSEVFSLIIIPDLTAPLIEHIVPPPNA